MMLNLVQAGPSMAWEFLAHMGRVLGLLRAVAVRLFALLME
jgi:hypothetical protein